MRTVLRHTAFRLGSRPARGALALGLGLGLCFALGKAGAEESAAAGKTGAEESAAAGSRPERTSEGGGASPEADTATGPWRLPAPDACSPRAGLRARPGSEQDAEALPVKPGDTVSFEKLERLRQFVPAFLWEHRERFFFEGMRLRVGPCFRDYSPPAFYREATRRFAGEAELLENGGLEGYTAGRPFPPERIDADDPKAGLQWLWNVEHRYQGAGFRGRFRMTDLVGRVGRAEPFLGEIFKLLLAHRADRPGNDYRAEHGEGYYFAAGGVFHEPFNAREFAWRQFRGVEHQTQPKRSDELHAYLPQWRRVRRLNANRVEGLYMPSFSVGVQQSKQLAVGSGGGDTGGVAAAGGAANSVGGSIKTQRSGFEGLTLRPLLWDAEVVGLHDVLALINATTPRYPAEENRDFGPWGLSFASDTWDLRRALVLDARARGGFEGGRRARMILYVDLQTGTPLYMAAYDGRGTLSDVGMYVGRWSEDRNDYPGWPGEPERPVRVIDPVGAAFANLSAAGSWRRESWEIVSTPPPSHALQRRISVNELTKGR